MSKKPATLAAALAALLVSTSAFADPPRWAPAHGARAKPQAPHHYQPVRGHYAHYPAHRVVVVHRPYVQRHYVVPAKVIVHQPPAYVVTAPPLRPAPLGWTLDVGLRFGGDWR
jgi:hypothetical protein